MFKKQDLVNDKTGEHYTKYFYTFNETDRIVGILFGHFAPFTGPNGHGRMVTALKKIGAESFLIVTPNNNKPFDDEREMFDAEQRAEIIQSYLDSEGLDGFGLPWKMKRGGAKSQMGPLVALAAEKFGLNIRPVFCFGPDREDLAAEVCNKFGEIEDPTHCEYIVDYERGTSGTKVRQLIKAGDVEGICKETGYKIDVAKKLIKLRTENMKMKESLPTATERKAAMEKVKNMSIDELIEKYIPKAFINDKGELEVSSHLAGTKCKEELIFSKTGVTYTDIKKDWGPGFVERHWEWKPGDKEGSYSGLDSIATWNRIPRYVIKLIFEKFNKEMNSSRYIETTSELNESFERVYNESYKVKLDFSNKEDAKEFKDEMQDKFDFPPKSSPYEVVHGTTDSGNMVFIESFKKVYESTQLLPLYHATEEIYDVQKAAERIYKERTGYKYNTHLYHFEGGSVFIVFTSITGWRDVQNLLVPVKKELQEEFESLKFDAGTCKYGGCIVVSI